MPWKTNMTAFMADAQTAGLVVVARVPVVLTSRALARDSGGIVPEVTD